jgi:hypothetical protein
VIDYQFSIKFNYPLSIFIDSFAKTRMCLQK